MNPLLLRTGFRHLRRRPLQALLCVLGIALGVAVVVAIDLANASAARAFTLSTETVAGRATHQIVGGAAGLDEDVYRRIKVELGIGPAAPVVEGYAVALELDQQPLRILGLDVFAEAPFRSFLGGPDAPDLRVLADFLSSPDAVLIGDQAAERYRLRAGDAITLRVSDRRFQARVAGILRAADGDSRRALDGLAVMDVAAAQELLGMPGRLSRVDLIADERTEAGRAILERVREILPPGARVVKPAARSQSVESLTDAFQLNLTALSLLALVVGMFLIYNTITFSVVQRRPVIGILRCLGVTRREVFGLILAEAAVLGAIGAAAGLALGLLLGRGAVGLVAQTINDLYYTLTVREAAIDAGGLLKGAGLGIGAAVLAALPPALEATSIEPVGVLKRSSIEQRVRRLLPFVALAGSALALAGAAMLLATRALALNLGGIFGVVIGIALMSPLLTVALMRAVAPVLGRLAGTVGRMAARGVAHAISRTAIAVASLMIAVSVIIGLQSMIGSFRLTVETWLDASLIADVYLSPPVASGGAFEADGSLDPRLAGELAGVRGVQHVVTLRRAPVDFAVGGQPPAGDGWRPAALLAIDSPVERRPSTYVWADGDASRLWESMRGQDAVQVSEPFANRYGIQRSGPASFVTLRADDGPRSFRVTGVYYDYGSDQGVVLMRRDTYDRHWRDSGVSSLALHLAPEAQPRTAAFVDDLRARFAGRDLVISANHELRANALAVFDRTFAITGALNLLATVVAFIGVLSALMALQIERTRELGMLRANGMTLGQLWRMTLIETGLMGGAAGLLSFPTGFLLALILVYIINLRSFGWTIRLDLQWTTFAQAMLVAVGSALLAAVYPMMRMTGIQIASAVRQE
jgi:putative ABC transport system permease protein